MQHISDIFTDLGSIIDRGQKEPNDYSKSSNYVYKPENARFKLAIYFKDGNTRYYYSYDNKTHNKIRVVDESEGLMKLIRLIEKYKGKYKNAIVYATLDKNKPTTSNYNCEVIKYNMYDISLTNKHINFKVDGKFIIFDIERMLYLNKLKIE